ncbi:hypothetical protein SLEP1_g16521 [Rubroshorea leprosula]|uniref:Transmembrane protein n=1 Tax=Rubroshorea leprosula TaxID=152421 RepID=A0AAV5IX46_9ROSI|nr:hypothetical protein SLEP1_g16521 [Rubroshorea leprosula]
MLESICAPSFDDPLGSVGFWIRRPSFSSGESETTHARASRSDAHRDSPAGSEGLPPPDRVIAQHLGVWCYFFKDSATLGSFLLILVGARWFFLLFCLVQIRRPSFSSSESEATHARASRSDAHRDSPAGSEGLPPPNRVIAQHLGVWCYFFKGR